MNSRILLLLLSTVTATACANPTPGSPVGQGRAPDTVETTTTTSVAPVPTTTTTTKPPAPPPPARKTTTTKPPPPQPPKRRALPAGDNRLPTDQINLQPFDRAAVNESWKAVCHDGNLCVKIVTDPPSYTPENSCVNDIKPKDGVFEGDVITYVLRKCGYELPPSS